MSDSTINLYSRKEAFVKGAVLERPEKHEVLLTIEERTTIKNTRNQLLVKYEELTRLFSGKYSDNSLHKTIIELKLDNLIIIIPGLVYDETTRKLIPETYFIAKPEKKSYDVPDIFNEIINVSAEAIVSYVKNGHFFIRDNFWKDLEKNLVDGEIADASYPDIYFNIKEIFDHANLDFQVEKRIFEQYQLEIMKKLVSRRKAVWLPNQKIFLINDTFMDELFQTLKVFFYNRILPQYEIIPVVSRECDVIKLQEEIFAVESENRKTMTYTASKAFAVEKYLHDEIYKGQSFYPGSIVIALIRELNKFANEYYEKKYIAFIYAKYEELKHRICKGEHHAYQPIYFMTEEEVTNYPLESIEKVKNERTIIHTTWEHESGTIQLFMEITYDNFASALDYLTNIPDRESWKILAYRKLLQDSEKITSENNPFNNKIFYGNYAVLLNNAYLGILPFYYNLLLLIQVNFIRNLVYRAIKHYIEEIQMQNKRLNQKKRETKQQLKIENINAKKASLKRLVTRNRILEELDFFYFKQNLVPCIMDIKERFPDIKETPFLQMLDEFKFTIIKTETVDRSGQNILFYPKNITWKYNIEKTRKKIEQILKEETEVSKSDSQNNVLIKRAQTLNANLQLI